MARNLGRYSLCGACWCIFAATAATPAAADYRRAQRAIKMSAFTTGLWGTLLVPEVYLRIDRLTGVPNAARLLTNLTAVCGAWIYQPWADTIGGYVPSRTRLALRHGLALTTGASMLALFALARRAGLGASEPGDFTRRYGGVPYILEYTTVGHAYVGASFGRIIAMHWTLQGREHLAADPRLRLRMRIIVIGFAVALLYNVAEIGKAVQGRLGAAPAGNGSTSDGVLVLLGFPVLTLIALPLFGSIDRLARYRLHCGLYPLRQRLVAAIPGLLCDPIPPRLLDALPFSGREPIKLRLHQRVTEIWDGIATLYPYRDGRIAARARALCCQGGLTDEQAQIVVEAAILAGALEAKRREQIATPPIPPIATPDDLTLDGQAVYLYKLSKALRSPIVRAAQRPA